MEEPMDYVVKGHENKTLKLKRVVYKNKHQEDDESTHIFKTDNFIKCSHKLAF